MSCKRVSRVKGAVIGTTVGAVIGAIVGGDKRMGAIRGAAIGAGAGGIPRWKLCDNKLPRPALSGPRRRRRRR